MRNSIVIPLILFIFTACSSSEEETPTPTHTFKYDTSPTTVVYRNDVTVSSDDLVSYDVYYDSESEVSSPVVIWVHGGGWTIGDKINKLADKVAYFESLGYVLYSVNYRLSPTEVFTGNPSELENPDRIKFPIHPDDVAKAFSDIYENMDQYHGDKSKIVVMGHSAGAHISALVSTDPQYLEVYGLTPMMIKGLAGFDTEAYDVERHFNDYDIYNKADADFVIHQYISDPDFEAPQTMITYLNAFGNIPNDWRMASPILHLNKSNIVPKYFVAFRGEAASNQKRRDLIQDFVDELSKHSKEVISFETNDYSHESMNEAIGLDNPMTESLTVFLNDCLK